METHSSHQQVRGYERFKAKERALIHLPLDSEIFPHHIIDICEGGLSFRYLGKKIKTSKIPPINLYHEYELIVSDLPVKKVSDYRLRDGLVPLRRRSLCFGSLSIEQHNKLSTFIERFTERQSYRSLPVI
jgi:hypothetical protein